MQILINPAEHFTLNFVHENPWYCDIETQLLRQYLQAIFSDSLRRFVSSSRKFTETTTLPKSFNLKDKAWWNSIKLFSENQGTKEMDDSTSAFYHTRCDAFPFTPSDRLALQGLIVCFVRFLGGWPDGAEPCPVGHRSILTKIASRPSLWQSNSYS